MTIKEAMKWMDGTMDYAWPEIREAIHTLYDAIKHGDEKHQKWLYDKIKEHFEL